MSADSNWSDFLQEGITEKTIFTYIQGLQEVINNLQPKTLKEKNRLTLAKQHLREIRRQAQRMLNKNVE